MNTSQPSLGDVMKTWDEVLLVKKGKSAQEIKEILEDRQYQASIYIVPDTLDYLKKGGRLTPAVASFAKG